MIAIRILFGVSSYIKTTNNYFQFNYRTCAVVKTGLQIIYLIFGVVLYIWICTRHDKFNCNEWQKYFYYKCKMVVIVATA